MSIEIIVAATGILGVMASTLVQLYLGRQQEARKKIIEIRAQAYMDLVNAVATVCKLVVSPEAIKNLEPEEIEMLLRAQAEAMMKLTQAKSRVVVVGSNGVVKAIEEFWREYGNLNTPEEKSSFTLILGGIRKDLSGKNSLSNNLLKGALFGPDA
jgi:adenylate kinase